MKEQLILIGGGGHCRSVMDTLKTLDSYEVIGIIDKEERIGEGVEGIPIIGTEEELPILYNKGIKNAFITLGSIGDVRLRKKIATYLKEIGYHLPVIKDKTAYVSSNTLIEEGCFIGKGSLINTGVTIKQNSIINTGTIIEHECSIGAFVHLAPGTTLSGGVKVKDNAHIGAGSTIIQNVVVGENTLIGAGSVVVQNIEAGVKAFGNPCKVVEKR